MVKTVSKVISGFLLGVFATSFAMFKIEKTLPGYLREWRKSIIG